MKRKDAVQKINKLIEQRQSLHDLAETYNVIVTTNSGKDNKGWAGHVIEKYLGLKPNSGQAPDFGSWELKTIPLKKLKNGKLVAKETMAITMINADDVMAKDFEDSHLLAKLNSVVIMARTVGKTAKEPSYVHSVIELDLQNRPALYQQVKEDYEQVRQTLLDPDKGFTALTGEMGMYIQPRTKGKGHGTQTRAFYARKEFLHQIFDIE